MCATVKSIDGRLWNRMKSVPSQIHESHESLPGLLLRAKLGVVSPKNPCSSAAEERVERAHSGDEEAGEKEDRKGTKMSQWLCPLNLHHLIASLEPGLVK